MKRWILLVVLVVGFSAAGAVALQTMPTLSASKGPKYLELSKTGAPKAAPTGLQPKLVIVEGGATSFEFGIMPQRTTGKHTWLVKNEGDADLELRMESATCSCTVAKFKNGEKAVIKPGESEPIDLEFETRENNGSYKKGAKIVTNDPEKAWFDLEVKGLVFPALQTFPPEGFVNFANVSNDQEENISHIAVFSKDRPETKITKISTSSKYIEVDQSPATESDCKQLQLKAGIKLTVKVKSGMPLGFFKEEVVVTSDHPKQPEIRFTVGGRMTGAITVMPNTVVMHQADGKLGSQSEVSMVVRNLRPTTFKVARKPEGLDVAVVPGSKEGRYKLTVSVPPGSKSGKIEGEEIVLETDHPKADKVMVPVSIWILNTN